MNVNASGSFRLTARDVGLLLVVQLYNSSYHLAFQGDVANRNGAAVVELLRIVAKAVYGEEGKPESFSDLKALVSGMFGTSADEDHLQPQSEKLRQGALEQAAALQKRLDSLVDGDIEAFLNMMHKVKHLTMTKNDDPLHTRARFSRESPIGVYLRRCTLAFDRLTFDGCVEVYRALEVYAGVAKYTGRDSDSRPLDPMAEALLGMDAHSAPDAFRDFTSMRRYFDLRGGEAMEAAHQRALYRLAELYYWQEAYPAAYDAVEEGIRLARLAGDRKTLESCISLRRRLDRDSGYEDDSQLPPVLCGPPQAQKLLASLRNVGDPKAGKKGKDPAGTEKQGQTEAAQQEDAWDAREELRRIVVGQDQKESVGLLQARLVRAKYLGTPRADGKDAISKETTWEQTPWLAAAAHSWRAVGEGDLASVYDELIEKDDGEYVFASDGRVYAVVSKAEQLRRTGQYEEALYELFGQAAQARFTAANAKVWQTQVCRVVRSMAIHHGLLDLADHVYNLSPEPIDPESDGHIEKQIRYAKKMNTARQSSSGLMPVLEAVTISERLSHRLRHAHGSIVLAELLMDFQMADRGLEIIDEARVDEVPGFAEWPEMMGYCRMTQARCAMAEAAPDEPERVAMLQQAVQRLHQATEFYLKVDDQAEAARCVRYVAMIHAELGDAEQRDQAVKRYSDIKSAASAPKKAEELAVKKLLDKALAAMVQVPALYRAVSVRPGR